MSSTTSFDPDIVTLTRHLLSTLVGPGADKAGHGGQAELVTLLVTIQSIAR